MYQISIEKRAVGELERIAGKQRNRLLDAIDRLRQDPRPSGCKKLKGRESWRIRVGDYRIVYATCHYTGDMKFLAFKCPLDW